MKTARHVFWGGNFVKHSERKEMWERAKLKKKKAKFCTNVSRRNWESPDTVRRTGECCVCTFRFLSWKIQLHAVNGQFCCFVCLFLPFFFFLAAIYLPFGWNYIYQHESVDWNLRGCFPLNKSPPCPVAMAGGGRLASDRRGTSRRAELIFNQDFQGLFIYIIIFGAPLFGITGGSEGLWWLLGLWKIKGGGRVDGWAGGREKNKKEFKKKKKSRITLWWTADQQRQQVSVQSTNQHWWVTGVKQSPGRVWECDPVTLLLHLLPPLHSLPAGASCSAPPVLAASRVSGITRRQPSRRRAACQRFVDSLHSISLWLFGVWFWAFFFSPPK